MKHALLNTMIWSGEGFLLVSVQNMKTLSLALTEFSPTGTFTYTITSHLNNTRTIPVNLNDIEILHIPCTRNWQLNPKYIPQLLRDLNSSENFASPLIDFLALDALVLDILEGKSINVKFFIIPDWPCAEWYKTLQEQIIAEAVKLPNEEDLFIVKKKYIRWYNRNQI